MARSLKALKERARARGVPCIYVNDNFGRWQSDFTKHVEHCLTDGVRGEEIVRLLPPSGDDYFVLKPKNSAFYGTTLETLLEHLQTDTLILTGMAGNICVLFSANDAHMRNYHVVVPSDCIASESHAATSQALRLMKQALSVRVCASTELDLCAV